MNDAPQTQREFPRPATLVVAGVTLLICLFGNLGAIGLVGPDESRYVWIARAMAETGDWVTPRLYGQPWFEKPGLYYWAAALGFKLHLSAEWAARLPCAFAALAAALAIGWLGRRYYGNGARIERRVALLAPLLFAASVAGIGFARAATPDMLFSASLTLAMASVATILRKAGVLRACKESQTAASGGDAGALIAFGVFLGLAVLAKGPAAVVLAGGALLLWALVTRRWRAAIRCGHPLAFVAFCIVALPWYVVCALRNPDFLRIFLFQHNVERYLTPVFQHRQPFWFFGPIVLLALLPWTIFLWPAAQEGLRLWRARSYAASPGFFFFCWAAVPIVFFSFSQSKLPSYILPAIPPLALVCAVAAVRALSGNPLGPRAISLVLGFTWLALALAGMIWIHRVAPGSYGGYFAAALAVLMAVLIGLMGQSQWQQYVMLCCAVAVGLSVEAVNLGFLPTIDRLESARPAAQFLRNDLRQDRIFTYRLRREWNYGLAFYFHRELPEWSPSDTDAALVLTSPAGLAEIRKLGRFRGTLEEPYGGILYVPIMRVPR